MGTLWGLGTPFTPNPPCSPPLLPTGSPSSSSSSSSSSSAGDRGDTGGRSPAPEQPPPSPPVSPCAPHPEPPPVPPTIVTSESSATSYRPLGGQVGTGGGPSLGARSQFGLPVGVSGHRSGSCLGLGVPHWGPGSRCWLRGGVRSQFRLLGPSLGCWVPVRRAGALGGPSLGYWRLRVPFWGAALGARCLSGVPVWGLPVQGPTLGSLFWGGHFGVLVEDAAPCPPPGCPLGSSPPPQRCHSGGCRLLTPRSPVSAAAATAGGGRGTARDPPTAPGPPRRPRLRGLPSRRRGRRRHAARPRPLPEGSEGFPLLPHPRRPPPRSPLPLRLLPGGLQPGGQRPRAVPGRAGSRRTLRPPAELPVVRREPPLPLHGGRRGGFFGALLLRRGAPPLLRPLAGPRRPGAAGAVSLLLPAAARLPLVRRPLRLLRREAQGRAVRGTDGAAARRGTTVPGIAVTVRAGTGTVLGLVAPVRAGTGTAPALTALVRVGTGRPTVRELAVPVRAGTRTPTVPGHVPAVRWHVDPRPSLPVYFLVLIIYVNLFARGGGATPR